ncbi:MAG: hypothetical protein AAB954_01635 [Patescibacteria group bacterium]
MATNGKDLPKKIAVLFSDVKRSYFPTEAQYITEKGAEEDAKIIAKYINKFGIETHLLAGNSDLPFYLREINPDIAINLVDSFKGFENLSSSIPGILEILEIPYTGADILGISLDTNKFVIKKLLEQNGVPVPRFQLFATPNDPIDPVLRFPLISKLNEIHGAVEITKDAVSDTERQLRERLKFLIKTYKQPVLVEEFIVGREVTAILLEGLNKKVYLAEKVFNQEKEEGKYIFSTFEDQWLKKGSESFHYAKFDDTILREYVKKAFDITRMYDYGKFDIRIDQSGRYFFIDSNTNPAFGPKECDVAISVILDLYGISFQEILKRLMLNTVRDAQGKERLPPAGASENS